MTGSPSLGEWIATLEHLGARTTVGQLAELVNTQRVRVLHTAPDLLSGELGTLLSEVL